MPSNLIRAINKEKQLSVTFFGRPSSYMRIYSLRNPETKVDRQKRERKETKMEEKETKLEESDKDGGTRRKERK